MDNILLCVLHPTSLNVLLMLGQYLKGQAGLNPILVLMQSDLIKNQEIENVGLEYVIPSVLSSRGRIPKRGKHTFRSHLFAAAKHRLKLEKIFMFKMWNQYQNYHKTLKKDLVLAERVFNRYNPSALALPDDRSVLLLPYIRIAQDRQLTTVVVPISFSNQIGVSIRRVAKEEHSASGDGATLWNRYIAWRYPQQIHKFRGRKLLFYPASLVHALNKYGMLPPNPWVLGGGNADYLTVDGYDSKEQAVSQGVPEEKIRVTGHVSYDVLHQRFTNRAELHEWIIDKYCFDPSKKIIICAVPQLAEHNMITWDKHWKDVEALVQVLESTGQNILLSLHPKSDSQKYRYLEKKYKCRLADENLDQILVAAWLFVAGYSSTIRWAVLCGIPSIVINFNRLDYDIYDHWDGVLLANSPQAFAELLDQILQNKAFYARLHKKQRSTSRSLTIFDGNAHKRLSQVIEQAINPIYREGAF